MEGPSASDPPCIPYLYFSATDPVADTNSGLMGPLLVCKKGSLAESGLQVLLHDTVTCWILVWNYRANEKPLSTQMAMSFCAIIYPEVVCVCFTERHR